MSKSSWSVIIISLQRMRGLFMLGISEANGLYREKQYKDRLAAWHIRKNIKAKEVHVMIRKQQKRAARGKQTAFRVGGQQVDSKRISRFLRRYGQSWDNNATTTAAAAAAAATTAPVATNTAAAARARTAANPKSPPGSHTTPEPGMLSKVLPMAWNGMNELTLSRHPDRHELLHPRTRRKAHSPISNAGDSIRPS